MSSPLVLFLDLGDVLTKGIALSEGRQQRLRFPSVVARQVLNRAEDMTTLLLDRQQGVQRPIDFDADQYPRIRSYPNADMVLTELQSGSHPVSAARFAGWMATAYGADRQLLGRYPSAENIEAIVRKALLLCAPENTDVVQVVLVVDLGAKADALSTYAHQPPRATRFESWSLLRSRTQRLELTLHTHLIDAAQCAEAALPNELTPPDIGWLLLIDIGYLRTKLAILSPEGCEHQEQVEGLGVSDCVRRVLRDEAQQGLVEDEFALIHALEQSQATVQIAGRTFDIGPTLQSAREALEHDLGRAAQRAVLELFQRRGEKCDAVAIVGGGSAMVGAPLAASLKTGDLPVTTAWVATDPSFLLLEGARRCWKAST
jgi:hypothetical protein